MKFKVFYYWLRKWFLIKMAILGAPVFYFLISRRKREYQDAPRILIVPQLTRIGDLVCATPMFRLIKKHLPKSYLAVLVTNRTTDIIKNNPSIDEIIVFKSVDFVKRVLKEGRDKKFDWAFNISATAVGSLVSFYGLIPNRVKLVKRPRSSAEFLTDWIANYKLRYHHHTYLPQYYLRMLEFIGIRDIEEVKQIFTTKAGDEKVRKFFSDKRLALGDLLVGISITAQNRIKEWGDEKFKEVAKYLNQEYGAKVIFLGIPKDEQRIDNLIRSLRHSDPPAVEEEPLPPRHSEPSGEESPVFLKAVHFSLEELPSLIKRLNLYIAVDTGPIYIAHALKVPLIDITGPCDPNEQPPNDSISIQVRPPAHIKPSSFVMKKAGKPEEHKKALINTKIEDVLNAADKLIGEQVDKPKDGSY